MRNVRVGAAVLLMCAVLLLPGAVRRLQSLTLRTVPAVRGTLLDERPLRALVVRNEVVVGVPAAGRFVALAAEESRVRTGEVVGIVVTDSGQTAVRAPRPGIVRFHWDGWEGPLAQSLWQRTAEQWRSASAAGGRLPGDELIEEGTPVVRLVDSHAIRLYADVPQGVDLRPGQTVTVYMADVTSETLRAKVMETRHAPSGAVAVLLELDRYLPLLDAVRHIDVQLVLARHEGVIVPADALVWDETGAGLLVLRDGRATFTSVRLVAQVADTVAVDGVPTGASIIVNPWRVAAW